MIDQGVISKVRNGVCAVGYLTVPLPTYLKDLTKPYFKVVGTGFLVRDTTVVTNRHVIEGLLEEQADLGFPDNQFFISFVAPHDTSDLQITLRMIRGFATHEILDLDVGFLEFQRKPAQQFKNIYPLVVSKDWNLRVTAEICVCGYPYGNAMLEKDGRVYRWGPVIQQGHISALSPFDTQEIPNEILLDVRTAGGMSGAPIFRPDSGEVVGIHHSGIEATTAFGLPLTKSIINSWLTKYDDIRG